MAAPIRIDDPEDPRLAPYRDVRERDLVGRLGGFIAEGEVVVRALARSRLHRPDSLLLAEKRVDALADVIERLPTETPVYAASQAVMDAVVGFPIHRGILAAGRRGAPVDPGGLLAGLPPRALVLVLCGISNHDNVGGLFRNAAAFGADAVLLDARCSDPLYRQAIRVSVGAALNVPFARLADGADPLGLLAAHGFEALALSPRGEMRLAELSPAPRTAVLVGAEGPGLSDEFLARARTVRIPMAKGFDSLNVSVSAGIVLHHLRPDDPQGERG
jgi:tRNA G18 (ribose-2'-O)-methylase SpoU